MNADLPPPPGSTYLFISGHDARSRRKVGLHFITEVLARENDVLFFSIGYSLLSKLKRDPRTSLDARSNQVETHGRISSYLWRTALHPGNPGSRLFQGVSRAAFKVYTAMAPRLLKEWMRRADMIFIESGMAPIFIALARRNNPTAKIVYIAADDLATIRCDPYIMRCLAKGARKIDWARLPSRALRPLLPAELACYYIPQGIDRRLAELTGTRPYGDGLHAVSVGTMLFDARFFEIAAPLFPEVHFHLIGGGVQTAPLAGYPNITIHGELPFEKTVPFIAHADFGIAPYRGDEAPAYLRDTSLKLKQYEFLDIPAVCPSFVGSADHPTRFVYEAGDAASIKSAIDAALAGTAASPPPILSWEEVTRRTICPQGFADTRIDAQDL